MQPPKNFPRYSHRSQKFCFGVLIKISQPTIILYM